MSQSQESSRLPCPASPIKEDSAVAKSKKDNKRSRINGLFYPWLIEMGESEAMCRLRKNSDAVNALTLFITKWRQDNGGRNLCVTYGEARAYMSTSTFAKAKLWCQAFGFIFCSQYGRLERNPSLYDLIGKWRWLSRQSGQLDKIERLLRRHDRILRIPAAKIETRNRKGQEIQGSGRKRTALRFLEQKVLGVRNEP